jgi:acetoin utilization protein AcuB
VVLPADSDQEDVRMDKLTVREWMTSDPITVPLGTSLWSARHQMERDEIRRLLVVDNQRLVGIVTWGDVAEAWPSRFTGFEAVEVRELMARVSVDEIMTTDVDTIEPDASIAEAANLMFEARIGALPVLEGTRVAGILTTSDILQGLVRILAGRGD